MTVIAMANVSPNANSALVDVDAARYGIAAVADLVLADVGNNAVRQASFVGKEAGMVCNMAANSCHSSLILILIRVMGS